MAQHAIWRGQHGEVSWGAGDTAAIVAYLQAHPEETPLFASRTIDTIRSVVEAELYDHAAAWFALMCDVLKAARAR